MADTGDLGKQAELLTQINSLLEKRCQLESNLAKSCSKQGAMAQEAAQAMSQQSSAIDDVGSGWTRTSSALDEAAKKQSKVRKESDGFLKGMMNKSKGLMGATFGVGLLVKAFKGLGNTLAAVGVGIKSAVKGLFNVGKSILKIPFKVFKGLLSISNEVAQAGVQVRQAWEDVRKEFGSFAEGPGKSVKGAISGLAKESGNLAGTGLSVGQVFGFGPEGTAKMIKETGALAKALGPNLGMMTEEFKKSAGSAVMFSKGLGLSADQMAGLMKDAKLSGKSQSDMMTEIGSQSLQMAEKFGLSSKDIGRDIADMKKGFVTFGGMSTKTMAASSAYARKLGMDMKDLKGVVDKFDDFEGAADSVGQLNQAFGIQLDTMKMMNAENPAERIDMMRKAFFAAGKSIETMNRHEKKLLMTQTGLSESALKNAFSAENQGVAYEDFADAAEDAEEQQMSQAEVMKKLAKGIEKITKIAMKFSGVFDAIYQGFMHVIKFNPEMQQLWRNIQDMMWAFFDLGGELAKFFIYIMKASGLLQALMDYFDPGPIRAFTKGIKGPLLALAKWIATGKGNPDELFKTFFEKFQTLFSQRGEAGKNVGTALGRLGTMFLKVFEKMVAWLMPKVMNAFSYLWQSVTDWLGGEQGKKFMKGVKDFLVKAVVGAFKMVFAVGGGLLKAGVDAIGGWFEKDMPNALNAASKGANLAMAATGVGGKIIGNLFPVTQAAILAASVSKNFEVMDAQIDSSLKGSNRTIAVGAAAMAETLTFGLMPDGISQKIGNFYGKVLTTIDGFAEKVGLGMAWDGIKDRAAGSFEILVAFGDVLRGLFSSDPKKLQQGLERMFKGIFKSLIAIPKIIFGLLGFLAKKVVPFVLKTLMTIAGTILLWFVTELPKAIYNGIATIVEGVIGAFKSLFKLFTDSQYRAEMWETLKSYAGNMLSGLMDGLSAGWTYFKCWLNDLWTRFKDFWGIKSDSTKMKGAGGNIVGGLMSPISNLWKSFKCAFSKAWEKVTEIFSWQNIKDTGMRIVCALLNGLGDLPAKLWALGKKALKEFLSPFSGSPVDAPTAPSHKLGASISRGLGNGLKDMGPAMTGAAVDGLTKLGLVMGDGTKMIGKHFSKMFRKNITFSVTGALIDLGKSFMMVFFDMFKKVTSLSVSALKKLTRIFIKGFKSLTSGVKGSGAADVIISSIKAVTSGINNMMRFVLLNMTKLSKIIGVMGKRGMGITRFSLFSRQNKNIFLSLAKLFGDMVSALRRVKWATVINQLNLTTYAVGQIEKTFSTLANINIVDVGNFDFFKPSFSDRVVEGYTSLAVMFARIREVSDYYLGDMNQAPTHNIYKAVLASANIAKTMNRHYLGKNGRVVSVVSDLVETYNATYNALENVSRQPANLMVKLENFANSLGMDSSTFTVENEKLNFTINVGVVIDAEKMVDTLADRTVMGERTLKTVTGFAPFE